MGDNEFVEAEVESRGFRSVGRRTGCVGQVVVLRGRVLMIGQRVPCRILEDIAVWKSPAGGLQANVLSGKDENSSTGGAQTLKGSERNPFLTEKSSGCVACVLQLAGAEDVDPKAALADLGMDSVMTLSFRKMLQQELKIKVRPTLVWGHPTASHLVKWFDGQIA